MQQQARVATATRPPSSTPGGWGHREPTGAKIRQRETNQTQLWGGGY